MALNLFQENLENFLVVKELKVRPAYFTAHLTDNLREKQGESSFEQGDEQENCQVLAKSALSAQIDKDGQEKVIFAKMSSQSMPIASLSKLMTAVITEEFYPLEYVVPISERAIEQPEQIGWLKTGERLTVEELLHLILIESSNDAAFALTEPMGEQGGFVDLMNLKAEEIGMVNTHFYNATGLGENIVNFATAEDLIKLGKYLLGKPKILDITLQNDVPFYVQEQYHHTLLNTNELLEDMPDIIVAGKTGFTETAGGCLLIISQEKKTSPYRISVVLNSPDRFSDMRKLLSCHSFE